MMSEVKINGIGVSGGTRIGKAFLYMHSNETETFRETIEQTEVESELERLNKAKEQSYIELSELIESTKKTLGEEKATILQAQQGFLNDPSFYPEIGKRIEQKHLSAEKAVSAVVDQFVKLFSGMKDEYLKERATDLKDLGKRLLNNLSDKKGVQLKDINERVILIADDLTPSDTVQLNKEYIQAFITRIGGKTSHTAILSRSLEIPAIVGMGKAIDQITNGDNIIVDGNNGIVIIHPDEATIEQYEKQLEKEQEEYKLLKEFVSKPAITKDNKRIEIAANIGTPKEAKAAEENGAEGIGLYRTEFLFMNSHQLPTEEEQYEAYKQVAETLKDKPVIIRTLDIGGDKELDYMSFPKEMNPFLGYRAIRLTLDRKDIFMTQLRAILRASVHGKLKTMFPMISSLQEWRQAKSVLEEAKEQLKADNIEFDNAIEVGIMVEIPSAAVLAEQFAKEVDFFSIGTNDLVQYTLAVDRMNEKVAYLYDYFHPAVIQLIKKTIDAAHKEGKWAGMCGGMAGDPLAAPLLLGLGLDEWSMDAGSISRIKEVLSKLEQSKCESFAEEVLGLGTNEEVRQALQEYQG